MRNEQAYTTTLFMTRDCKSNIKTKKMEWNILVKIDKIINIILTIFTTPKPARFRTKFLNHF